MRAGEERVVLPDTRKGGGGSTLNSTSEQGSFSCSEAIQKRQGPWSCLSPQHTKQPHITLWRGRFQHSTSLHTNAFLNNAKSSFQARSYLCMSKKRRPYTHSHLPREIFSRGSTHSSSTAKKDNTARRSKTTLEHGFTRYAGETTNRVLNNMNTCGHGHDDAHTYLVIQPYAQAMHATQQAKMTLLPTNPRDFVPASAISH